MQANKCGTHFVLTKEVAKVHASSDFNARQIPDKILRANQFPAVSVTTCSMLIPHLEQ